VITEGKMGDRLALSYLIFLDIKLDLIKIVTFDFSFIYLVARAENFEKVITNKSVTTKNTESS
jgi:hypothetical protein